MDRLKSICSDPSHDALYNAWVLLEVPEPDIFCLWTALRAAHMIRASMTIPMLTLNVIQSALCLAPRGQTRGRFRPLRRCPMKGSMSWLTLGSATASAMMISAIGSSSLFLNPTVFVVPGNIINKNDNNYSININNNSDDNNKYNYYKNNDNW